jgi:hypothetical protein
MGQSIIASFKWYYMRRVINHAITATDTACYGLQYHEKKAGVQLSLDQFFKKVHKMPINNFFF